MSRTYEVQARWDSEAGVWVAESDDIPGLVAEAESMNALIGKVRSLVPELFELNGGLEPGQKVVNVLVRAHHEETAEALWPPDGDLHAEVKGNSARSRLRV